MRNVFLAFFLTATVFGVHGHAAMADPPPLTGEMSRFSFAETPQSFDQISLVNLQDNDVSLSQYRGKVVLVNVWATWCGPCVMEMPGLDHLSATLGGDDFVVLPVSIDRGGSHQANPFLNRMGVKSMTPLFDRSNSIGRFLSASRIPVTLIIGRDGNEIGRITGAADWDSEEARALLKYFINYGGNSAKVNYVKSDSQIAMTH